MAIKIPNHGSFGTAELGAETLSIVRWSVDAPASIVEFKNSRTGGYPLPTDKIKDCLVTLDFRVAKKSPLHVVAGTVLNNVRLSLVAGAPPDSLAWTFESLAVYHPPVKVAEIDGDDLVRLTAKGDGVVPNLAP